MSRKQGVLDKDGALWNTATIGVLNLTVRALSTRDLLRSRVHCARGRSIPKRQESSGSDTAAHRRSLPRRLAWSPAEWATRLRVSLP